MKRPLTTHKDALAELERAITSADKGQAAREAATHARYRNGTFSGHDARAEKHEADAKERFDRLRAFLSARTIAGRPQ
jgi:hypothetical protein